jgi:DNA-binding PadR family transcriptional regulator
MARGLTKKAYDLLFLLKNNTNGYMTAEELAYATHTSVIAIYRMLDRLQARGLVEKQKHGSLNDYTLTSSAQGVVKRIMDKRIAKPSLNMLDVYVRLHALAIKFPLIQPLTQPERLELLAQYNPKPKTMKNHTDYIFQYNDTTFKLTPSSLIVYAPQVVKPLGTPIPQMAAQAIESIKTKVYALETQQQAKNALFKLRRKTKTINNQKDYDYTIIEIHIALTNDIFAAHATEEQDPYIIAMSEIDNTKVSLLADKSVKLGSGASSQGIPEVEGVSHLSLPNGQPEAVPNMDTEKE